MTQVSKEELKILNNIIVAINNELTPSQRYYLVTGKIRNEMQMFIGGIRKLLKEN